MICFFTLTRQADAFDVEKLKEYLTAVSEKILAKGISKDIVVSVDFKDIKKSLKKVSRLMYASNYSHSLFSGFERLHRLRWRRECRW